MKKVIIGVLVVAILILVVVLQMSKSDRKTNGNNEGVTFMEKMTSVAKEKFGQPIHGFDAEIYQNVFPKLEEEDFDNVDTKGGKLVYKNNQLSFMRDEIIDMIQ